MGERSSSELSCVLEFKKKNLCSYILKRKEKENSLVLFYVVCVQLEPEQGARREGRGTRGGEGLKMHY